LNDIRTPLSYMIGQGQMGAEKAKVLSIAEQFYALAACVRPGANSAAITAVWNAQAGASQA
jgi:hypothetical protein